MAAKPKSPEEAPARIVLPKLSVPQGGGRSGAPSIAYIARENLGSGSLPIPLELPTARELSLELALNYASGTGNGLFGAGFSINVPAITVTTQSGVPRYDGHDPIAFAGDDIIPSLIRNSDGKWVPDITERIENGITWRVARYQPRVDEDFTLIEQWQNVTSHEVHWRSVGSESVLNYYGRTAQARIADPANPLHVAEWLIEESTNPNGERIVFHYRPENQDNVPDTPANHGRMVSANRYPDRIEYAHYADDTGSGERFAYQVVFDYGGFNFDSPASPPATWPVRADPYSSYHYGFERRFLRLCHGILVYVSLPELFDGRATLTRAYRMGYDQKPNLSLLTSFESLGFRWQADDSFERAIMPPLSLSYSGFAPQSGRFRTLRTGLSAAAPGYLDLGDFQLVDLDGDGLPGLLQSNAEATLYWPPQGAGHYGGAEARRFPITHDLGRPDLALMDLEANGQLDLVISAPAQAGYYPNRDGDWDGFRPFEFAPTSLANNQTDFVDLNASGMADLTLFAGNDLIVHPSLGTKGFGAAQRFTRPFPLATPGDATVLTTFADMFGDGMQHWVVIENGRVRCWPNLGHEQFGEPVTFDHAPDFGENFDAGRIRLIDADGSGCVDILYIHPDRADLYRNLNGNGFSDPISIPLPALFSELDRISTADILGSGCTGIVITQAAPETEQTFYDFAIDGTPDYPKPYLLVQIDNGLGAVTRIGYRSSTSCFLEDKRKGQPWLTRLPFPVQVVDRLEVLEQITGNRLVSTFTYHDGYFDVVEREFRGFAYVERRDSESYEAFAKRSLFAAVAFTELSTDLLQPPALTKSWYDVGAYDPTGTLANVRNLQYFHGDPDACHMPDTKLDPAIWDFSQPLLRQAQSAPKGLLLRQEVYGEDDSALSAVPYNVTQNRYFVRLLQPDGPDFPASFFTGDYESITYTYEREATDPRVDHGFALDTDAFGNITRQCNVSYKRRPGNGESTGGNPTTERIPEQDRLHVELVLNEYINAVDGMRWLGLPCQERSLDLFGLQPGASGYFTWDEIAAQVDDALTTVIPYAGLLLPGIRQARARSLSRTYFWNDAQTEALPLGQTGLRALQHHLADAIFPDGLLRQQELFSADSSFVPSLNAGVLPDGLRQKFAAFGIALPAGSRSTVTVLAPDQSWSITDQDIGQIYPIAATSSALIVSRQVFGALTPSLAEEAGYGLEDGYWWNRGEVAVYFTAPAQFHCLCATENLFVAPDSPLYTKATLTYDPTTLFVTAVGHWLDDQQQNVTSAVIDYQAGQPVRIIDPNLVTTEALYGPLGRLVATSIFKGSVGDKPLSDYTVRGGATFNDIIERPPYYLQQATTFQYHDPFAWMTGQKPAATITLVRETHVSDEPSGGNTAIQIQIVFSDGLGREIETKKVSDPGQAVLHSPTGTLLRAANGAVAMGTVTQRWRVSGRTVFNNKGLPVKVYLPYFSDIAQYERQRDVTDSGLLPPPTIVHYDPIGRATRIDSPKEFFNLTVYHAWSRWQHDEDDTVLQSVYYQTHINDPDTPPAEREALRKAAAFADTPDVLLLDPDGEAVRRIQILVQDNDGTPTPPQYLTTRLTLNAGKKVIAIADPRLMAMTPPVDNVQYLPDMAGDALLETAVDSGMRARVTDVNGNEIRRLDGREVEIAKFHDRLGRLTGIQVREHALSSPTPWWTAEHVIYGEGQSGDVEHNLRGQVYRNYDQSGVATYAAYNIQQQPLALERQLVRAYAGEVDWTDPAQVALDPDVLVTRWQYDALDRVTQEICPDGRTIVPGYGASSLMVSLKLAQDGNTRTVVEQIEHDASNQRISIALGNKAVSRFTFEDTTLRLLAIHTDVAASGGTTVLQDRGYTYDPVGNVTQTVDRLRDTVYFRQQAVDPVSDYKTDSIYRLIRATGVQQPGLAAPAGQIGRSFDSRDTQQLEDYTQTYSYDSGNNLTDTRHAAVSGNWTRHIAIAPFSNRGFPDGGNAAYDPNGNMTSLGALSGLNWSWRNGLLDVDSIHRDDGESDGAFFQYDGRGLRLRKTVRRVISASETELEETVYLGAYQRRRIYRVVGDTSTVILERHDLRALDDPRYGESPTASDAGANRDTHAAANLSPTPRAEGRRGFATEYRWTIDLRAREVASTATVLTRYPLQTLLGSITLELDDAANIVSSEEYYPYGDTAIFVAASADESSLKVYRYVGKERDSSTGLYYFGARYYASAFGRWLSADPAGFTDGTNLFLYVGGNPVSYTDPTGLGKVKKNAADVKKDLASAKGSLKKAEAKVKMADKAFQQNQNKYNLKQLQAATKARTTARSKVTRLTNQLMKLQSSKAIPTKPAFYNPGGPLVVLQPPFHPGFATGGGKLVTSPPTTAYIADLHKKARDTQIESDVRNYTMMSNGYIQSLPSKQLTCVTTDRKTTGSIGYQAGQIATKERALANASSSYEYESDQVVGHVPDVGATGLPYSPLGWFQQAQVSNSIVGGGLYGGRVITVYLVKESTGDVYQYG